MGYEKLREARCPVCGEESLVNESGEPVDRYTIVKCSGQDVTCDNGCGDFRVPVFYCDNPPCDSSAVETVPVSVSGPSDETRNYCYTCYEAYVVGVQHGRMIAGQQGGSADPRSVERLFY